SAVPWMAAMTGFGHASMSSHSSGNCRPVCGWLNSVMSAPAKKVLPRHAMTIALMAVSSAASAMAWPSPSRTALPSALTGGLSTEMLATPAFLDMETINALPFIDGPLPSLEVPREELQRAAPREFRGRRVMLQERKVLL